MGFLSLLLRLLPSDFRREFGPELLDTAKEHWRQARPSLGPAGRLRFWVREWWSVVRVAARLRLGRDGADSARASALDGLSKDIHHGIRSLIARPGFTIVAVLTLALGVGATTAMFSAVNSVLIRALPYRDAGRVVVVKQTDARDGTVQAGISAANLRDLAEGARTLSHAAIAEEHGLRLLEDGRAFSLRAWLVSEGFMEAIGGQPLLGRSFAPEEFVSGRERVVLLSHGAWQARFGGDPGVLGREMVLDGAAHTVIGVLPPEFRYPSMSEIWGPRPPQPWDDDVRARAQLDAVARLAPGVTVAEAQQELDRLARNLEELHPSANANLGLRVAPLREDLVGDVRSPLLLLLGAVGLVLLIASANVAGLQLARGASRAREYALRGALGASSGRILRLVTVESLLLGGAGCLVGVILAYLGVDLIRALGPDHLPRIDELRIDGTVLGAAVVLGLGSALIAGVAPAVRASRSDLRTVLAESTRGTTGGRRAAGLRDRLVVAEIAVALVLTVGAGLLVRSFDRLMDNELGFEPEGRLAVQVWAYEDNHQPKLDYFRQGVDQIRNVPGVEAVGLTTNLPLANDRSILTRGSTVPFTILDRAPPPTGEEPVAALAAIDGDYAAAMGIALVTGRSFSSLDHNESPPVAMVNEAFARRHFPEGDAIGQRVAPQWRDGDPREIVGVMADVRRAGLESEPEPEMYVPLSQEPSNGLTFVVKTSADPTTLATPVQEALWAADPSQASWATKPMTELLGEWVRQRRFNTVVLLAFAGLALALAGIGVYGLMSFSVEQRVDELGIRRALGGTTGDIMEMVLGRGLKLALVGAALGLVGAFALTRFLRGMLFGIDPLDPITFGAVSLFVVAVAVGSSFGPARRATRVDPMVALRME